MNGLAEVMQKSSIPFFLRIALRNTAFMRKYVYSTITEAMALLEKRAGDISINKNLKANDVFPKPVFCMFRHIATPNHEIDLFIGLCKKYNTDGVIWEYLSDKFTPNNPEKYNLGRMTFFQGRGRKGGPRIKIVKVIDFNDSDGKPIPEVKCLWGESLISFHHDIFNIRYPELKQVKRIDVSAWAKTHGNEPEIYYETFLENFACRAILFENLVTSNPEEKQFIHKVFLPAFYKVMRKFEMKPLVVPILPTTSEYDKYWNWYNSDILEYVEKKLNT